MSTSGNAQYLDSFCGRMTILCRHVRDHEGRRHLTQAEDIEFRRWRFSSYRTSAHRMHTVIADWGAWTGQIAVHCQAANPAVHLIIGVTSYMYGALGHVPLDFQQFNFSGHFRAAQTLTLDSMWLPIPRKNVPVLAYSFVTVYCTNFIIFLCVTLNYFLLGSCSSSQQIPATPLPLGKGKGTI